MAFMAPRGIRLGVLLTTYLMAAACLGTSREPPGGTTATVNTGAGGGLTGTTSSSSSTGGSSSTGSTGSTSSTGSTGGVGDAGCPDVPSQILAMRCAASICHGAVQPAVGLDLVSPDLAARLAGKMAVSDNSCPGLLLDPAHPAESLLYRRLTVSCGPRMPLSGYPLSAYDLGCVAEWIAAQAPGP